MQCHFVYNSCPRMAETELGVYYVAYLVVAHERVGKQLPFAFLEKVRAEFQEKYAESSRTLHAHSLDKTFGCATFGRACKP